MEVASNRPFFEESFMDVSPLKVSSQIEVVSKNGGSERKAPIVGAHKPRSCVSGFPPPRPGPSQAPVRTQCNSAMGGCLCEDSRLCSSLASCSEFATVKLTRSLQLRIHVSYYFI